ncbi:hypothetical protein Dimus_017379 [Dionaea muscipula]
MATASGLLVFLFECILLVLSFSSSEVPASEIPSVDVLVANDLLLRSGHRYLDVRTEEEFKRGHVDVGRPLNIPYMFNTPQGRVKNQKFMEQVMEVCNKDDHLIVVNNLNQITYC